MQNPLLIRVYLRSSAAFSFPFDYEPIVCQPHALGSVALVASCARSWDMCVKYVCRAAMRPATVTASSSVKCVGVLAAAEGVEDEGLQAAEFGQDLGGMAETSVQ